MKKKKVIISVGLIAFLVLGLLSPFVELSNAQGVEVHSEIIGDSIYTEIGNKGLLVQTPHTLTEWNGQVEVEFTSYFPEATDLDFAFGFDTDNIRPTQVELWSYYLHPNSTPVYGEKWYEAIVYNVTYIFQIPDQMYVNIGSPNAEKFYGVHILEENGTKTYKSIGFDTHIKVNDTCWRVFWSEDEIVGYEDAWYWDWKPINRAFKKVDIRNEPTWVPDLDKTWWVVTNATFNQDQTKKIRITIETTPQLGDHTYKYNVFIKKSEDTFREAFRKDRYVLLDPWILSNWQQKALLHIDNTGCTTALVNDPVFFNVTYQDGMNSSFIDLRFVNESTGTTLPHVVLDYAEGVNANCSFNVSYLQASAWDNTSYALYWDNALATDIGNGSLVFPFFDNFSGTSLDAGKWGPGNSFASVSNGWLVVSNGGSFDGLDTIRTFDKGLRVSMYGSFQTGKIIVGFIDNTSAVPRVSFYDTTNPGTTPYITIGSTSVESDWTSANLTKSIVWAIGEARFFENSDECLGSPYTNEGEIPDAALPVGICPYDGGKIILDYIYVHPWINPDPTVTLGTVESQPAYVPPTPVITNNETGSWWVNYTWEAGHYGTTWQNNSAIVNGSGDNVPSNRTTPTVFQMNGTWYRISGGGNVSNYGAYWGWNWTGLNWQNDSAIVNGLNNVTYANLGDNKPETFYYNDNLYFINCILRNPIIEPMWVWVGYRWNGTSWVNDSSIITGFTTHHPAYVYSSVFEMNDTLYAINTYGTNFTGWNYSGTTWQNDSVIVSGLYDINASGGGNLAPSVFNQSNEYYLIYGNSSGMFTGFKWDTGQWVYTPSATLGLTDVGSYAYPDVFKMNSSWYLVTGEYNGTFIGYQWLTNATDLFNVTVWNETVTIHDNLTTNTSINTTAGEGAWVNISIWAVNTTGTNDSISIAYAHRSTQLEEYGLKVWCFDEINGSMLNGFFTTINSVNKTASEHYNGYLESEVPYGDTYQLVYGCDGYETRSQNVTLTEQSNISVSLLGTGDGAYINFHVSDQYGYALNYVYVEAIVGNATVEGRYTDSTGVARLFLSPITQYTIRLTRVGYTTMSFNIIPTSSNYYFLLSTQTAPEGPTHETTWYFYPDNTSIKNESSCIFMLNATSPTGQIEYLTLIIENSTHIIFSETNTSSYFASIIADIDLSNYTTGDEIYVTTTLKEFGKDPLTLRASPYITYYVYSGNISETSLYMIIHSVGEELGDFSSNFLALILTLFFVGMVSSVAPPGSYGGGIMALIMLGFFGFFGWIDVWLLMVVGVCALSVYSMRGGTG